LHFKYEDTENLGDGKYYNFQELIKDDFIDSKVTPKGENIPMLNMHISNNIQKEFQNK
jgi:hypothetical protein